jgi:hypothetical protein
MPYVSHLHTAYEIKYLHLLGSYDIGYGFGP